MAERLSVDAILFLRYVTDHGHAPSGRNRHGITTICTLDRRHFGQMEGVRQANLTGKSTAEERQPMTWAFVLPARASCRACDRNKLAIPPRIPGRPLRCVVEILTVDAQGVQNARQQARADVFAAVIGDRRLLSGGGIAPYLVAARAVAQ